MATPRRAKAASAQSAALSHPVRRQILRAMRGTRATRPDELAARLDASCGAVLYHVRVLAHWGAVKQVGGKEEIDPARRPYRLAP